MSETSGRAILCCDATPHAAEAITVTGALMPGATAIVLTVWTPIREAILLQPVVYGRTVRLSPLVVLVAVLVGSDVAGVLGALGAIPVAGTLQILLADLLASRGAGRPPTAAD